MTTINVTEKLCAKIKAEINKDHVEEETFFGQWCANNFYSGHHQFVLITNEQTLLSVVIPAKEMKMLDVVFPKAVEEVLQRFGIPYHKIKNVIQELSSIQFSRQTKRQVLGSMNDFIKLSKYFWEDEPHRTITALIDYLNNTPCSPIKRKSPKKATLEILEILQ